MPDPVTPGGGGSQGDLSLATQLGGITASAEVLSQLADAIRRESATFSDQELKVAKQIREEILRTSAAFTDVVGQAIGSKNLVEHQKRLFRDIAKNQDLVATGLEDLKMALAKASGLDPKEKERGEEKVSASSLQRFQGELRKFGDMGGQIGQAVKGALSRVSSQITTMGVGGPLGLMLYGKWYESKLRAESQKYTQLWDRTLGQLDGPLFHKAKKHASQLGQQFTALTDTYRLSREEAAATLNTLSAAGINILQAEEETDILVGGTKAKVALATAAIDQHYRLAAGTAAQATTKIMHEFGYSAKKATEFVGGLATAGAKSGVGIQNFMNNTLQAASQIRQYGADASDALIMAQALQQHLESKGLKHHFAGALSVMVTGKAAAAVGSMSKGMQALLAQRMGMGGGNFLRGYYELNDALYNKTKSAGTYLKLITTAIDFTSDAGTRSRAQSIRMMETLMPGLDNQSATILYDSVTILKNANSTKEQKAKAQKDYNRALEDQRARTEDWRVGLQDLMRGLAKIGVNLFNLVVGSLSEMVLLYREVPLAIEAYMGTLARKVGLQSVLELPGIGSVMKQLAAAPVMPGSPLAAVQLAARATVHGGLSPQDEELRRKLGKARADAENFIARSAVGMLQGSVETAKAIPELIPDTAGVSLVAESFLGREELLRGSGANVEVMQAMRELGRAQQARIASGSSQTIVNASRASTDVEIDTVDLSPVGPDGRAVISVHYTTVQRAVSSVTSAVDEARAAVGSALRGVSSTINEAIEAAVSAGVPRDFARAMAFMESGFNPGMVGDPHIQQRSVGLFQVNRRMLSKELEASRSRGYDTAIAKWLKNNIGDRVPTVEELSDPVFNAKLWAVIAKSALRRAEQQKGRLAQMGRSTYVGARMMLAGLAPTAKIVSDPKHRRDEEQTRALLKGWEKNFQKYRNRE